MILTGNGSVAPNLDRKQKYRKVPIRYSEEIEYFVQDLQRFQYF